MKKTSLINIGCALVSLCCAKVAFAAAHYVDSSGGNDANTGLTQAQAWKTLSHVNAQTFSPGDSVLFICGGSWTGTLAPHGSGTSASPITIGSYGSGNAPLIQGGGATAAVALTNQQYWDIVGLEITNNAASEGTRYGVLISGVDAGTLHHIHLIDLEIHDVKGDSTDKLTGGALFQITGAITPTKFDDVLIDGCYVHDVTRTGVSLDSSWSDRTLTDNGTWTPSTNVVISNNVISGTASNGLIWRVSSSPLIQNNLFTGCGATLSGNACFVFNCDNAILQYNEAYGTVYNTGDADAGGIDGDYKCKNTIIQYNYVHDNGLAGIVAVCHDTSFNTTPIIRYNILQNNQRQVFRISGNVTNAQVYNNTINIDSDVTGVAVTFHNNWGTVYPTGTQYRNNIINNLSTSSVYALGGSTGTLFDYNLYYGQHPSSEPPDTHKLTSNPQLAAPGTGGYGLDTVDGYALLTGSPAVGSGVLMSSNGGRDYYGNAVSASAAPNRGAYNGAAEASLTVAKECETLAVYQTSGQVVSTTAEAGASNGQWLSYHSTATGNFITLSHWVPAGTYQIQLKVKKYNNKGTVQLSTSGDAVSYYDKDAPKNLYSATTQWATIAFTDTVHFPSSGVKYFKFLVTGKDSNSSDYNLGLDELILTAQ